MPRKRRPRGQATTTPPRGGSYRRTGGGGDRSRRHRSNSFWKRKAARNPFFTPRTGGAEVRTTGARRQRGPRSNSSLTSPDAIAGEKAMEDGRKNSRNSVAVTQFPRNWGAERGRGGASMQRAGRLRLGFTARARTLVLAEPSSRTLMWGDEGRLNPEVCETNCFTLSVALLFLSFSLNQKKRCFMFSLKEILVLKKILLVNL